MSQGINGSAGVSRYNRIVGVAIILLIALFCSCGHKGTQSGVTSPESGVQTAVGAQGVAPAVGASPDPTSDTAPQLDIPWLPALKQYAASLPPVTGQVVEPIRFGERQPDGTYIRDGRKMTLGEILASATPVACPPLTQTQLPDDWNKAAGDKPASAGKTTSGLGEIFNPPQLPPPIPLPGGWNPGPIIGSPGPVSPPIFGGPPTPGHIPYVGEGIGPLYDPNPTIYNVMNGPPVDVAILHMGPYGVYGALAVLTRDTIQLFAGPNALGGMGSWTARITINLPTQVTTWDPDPAYRHTVDGAYAVRLRVADMNNDGRDDLVVVMNWDDPAWPQGANQFGYNGTWVYYQNWSGYFDAPFSPGGCSREYDIAAFNAPPTYGRKNPLPDLLGVQNPHVPSNLINPVTNQPYSWDSYPTEYYDHSKFKDANPTADPTPTYGLDPFSTPDSDLQWNWSIETTTIEGTEWLSTASKWHVATKDVTYSGVVMNRPIPYENLGAGMRAEGLITSAPPMRARRGRFELLEVWDDVVATVPSTNSLLFGKPLGQIPPYMFYKWDLYAPRLLRAGGGTMTQITNPGEIQVSDLNGDGLSDMVIISSDAAYVLLNLGSRTFIITDVFPLQDDPQRAFVGSLYTRNEKDIAAIDSAASAVLVYRPIAK